LRKKQISDYPPRDLSPEHTKRESPDKDPMYIHPDVDAAYDYVDSILDTSDFVDVYAWHGWAIREAFLAGISYEQNNQGVTQ
jgi:hypothetical protein